MQGKVLVLQVKMQVMEQDAKIHEEADRKHSGRHSTAAASTAAAAATAAAEETRLLFLQPQEEPQRCPTKTKPHTLFFCCCCFSLLLCINGTGTVFFLMVNTGTVGCNGVHLPSHSGAQLSPLLWLHPPHTYLTLIHLINSDATTCTPAVIVVVVFQRSLSKVLARCLTAP